MDYVDNILGNIIVKHKDFYLKSDLTFTTDRSNASRFYLLKPGNSVISNGDKITLNSGNKRLSGTEKDLFFVDRDELEGTQNKYSLLITDGTDDEKAIAYNSTVFLISDKDKKTALKFSGKKLVNDEYTGITDINAFKFILEKASDDSKGGNAKVLTKQSTFVESNKGIILVVLLILLLMLSLVAGH